ncbi:AsmA family protein [Rhodobacteraceae bacterium RKSG542]|uniref:AsmA family protein n=1 Tax=Pseudovibrio flavus TaxID=2529854 RepID=UPI0012BC78C2|nr:AsmA-like C-terminal region-containing protein [Pseudovibrio flavus]MTI19167.1 AsmA family protein [Pseudovibrio flavus]
MGWAPSGLEEYSLNSVYITIGSTLIVALVAALLAPMFIDWSAYRSVYERYAEEVIGHQVTILGSAEISLLPMPAVTFTDVQIGQGEDPLLQISRFSGRIEIPALLRGEVRVMDMVLDRPVLNMALDEEGRADIFQAPPQDSMIASMDPASFIFENVEVTEGAFSIVDARSGKTYSGDNASMVLSARSLDGPFKAEGSINIEQVPYFFTIGTGRLEADDTLRVKAQIVPTTPRMQFALDGQFSKGGGHPNYNGAVTVRSVNEEDDGSVHWSVGGAFDLNVNALKVSEAELLLGPEDRPISAQGDLDVVFGKVPEFKLGAAFKQVDLDRIWGGGPNKPFKLEELGGKLASYSGDVPAISWPGTIAIDIPSIVIGGSVISNVDLDLETQPNGWDITNLSGLLPGRSAFVTSGRLDTGTSGGYDGDVQMQSIQPTKLAAWLQNGKYDGPAHLPSIKLDAHTVLTSRNTELDLKVLEVEGARTVGRLSYQSVADLPPMLAVDLESDRLDLDLLEQFSGAFSGLKPATKAQDISLQLRADELVTAGVTAKSVLLKTDLRDDTLVIERLRIKDFAGARVAAKGRIDDLYTVPSGQMEGELDATSMQGAVAVLKNYAPDNSMVQWFASAADALAPARLSGTLAATAEGERTQMALDLNGSVDQNQLDIAVSFAGRVDDWEQGDVTLEVSLGGNDGQSLLKQVGLDVLPVGSLSGGDVFVSVQGIPRTKMDYVFKGEVGESSLEMLGSFNHPKTGDAVDWSLEGAFDSVDLSSLALSFGRSLPVFSGDLSAGLSFIGKGQGDSFSLEEISGQLAGMTLQGKLQEASIKNGVVSGKGDLQLSSLDMRALTELLLGPDLWAGTLDSSDSVWPSTPLGPSLLDSVDLTLALKADQLFFSDDTRVDAATGALRLRGDEVSFANGEGRYAGGNVGGAFELTRANGQASLSGRVRLDGVDLEDVIWQADGRPVATGQLQVISEFEGIGRTVAGLVSGLSGGGTFTVSDGTIRGLNPAAFGLVIAAADAGLELDEVIIRNALLDHLEVGEIPFQSVEGNLGIASGKLRARNVSVDTQDATIFGSASVDLENWSVEGDMSIKVGDVDGLGSGAEPQAALIFSGALEQPERSVDVGPLLSYLNLRAIEQNVQRIEEEQARIAEQEQRLQEIKRQQEEAAKRKAEEEAQRIAAQKAAEEAERQKAAAAAEEQRLRKVEAERRKQEQAVAAQQAAQRAAEEAARAAAAKAKAEAAASSRQLNPALLDKIQSVLEEEPDAPATPPPAKVQPQSQSGGDLPALETPIYIGPHSENTVPEDAVKYLPPVEHSGQPKILVAPGDDNVGPTGSIGPLFDDVGPMPTPKQQKPPRMLELNGGRLLVIN